MCLRFDRALHSVLCLGISVSTMFASEAVTETVRRSPVLYDVDVCVVGGGLSASVPPWEPLGLGPVLCSLRKQATWESQRRLGQRHRSFRLGGHCRKESSKTLQSALRLWI